MTPTRERKFRVRHKRTGQLEIWDGLQDIALTCGLPDAYDWDNVEDYTGLKDKNRKEIYEGDIVTFDGNMTTDDSMGIDPNGYIYDEESIHSVVWNNKLAAWELNFDEDDPWKYKNHTRSLLVDGKCEVIGNIHENPELLGGK